MGAPVIERRGTMTKHLCHTSMELNRQNDRNSLRRCFDEVERMTTVGMPRSTANLRRPMAVYAQAV